MRTVECPACGAGFVMRRRNRCRRCRAVLVREGEYFINDEGDRVFLYDGSDWREVFA